MFLAAYEGEAKDFAGLLLTPGVGAKGLRALALLAELPYGAPLPFPNPARFAFAHGRKDDTPYPVDRAAYDRTIEILQRAVRRARLGERERSGRNSPPSAGWPLWGTPQGNPASRQEATLGEAVGTRMTLRFHVPRRSHRTSTSPPRKLLRAIPAHIPVVPKPNG